MRGQLDTAVGMILTITIVAALLVLAVWGFFQLTSITSDASYRAVYDGLTRAGASYAPFGSFQVIQVSPPEPFCVFNLSAGVDCLYDYSGHLVCESGGFESYWGLAGEEDGNVVFRSGINERVALVAPRNGLYACFRAGPQTIYIEGRGRYVTVSPMREVGSVSMTNTSLGASQTAVRGVFFTSHRVNDDPEIFLVDETASSGYTYQRTAYDVGSVTFTSIRAQYDLGGTLTTIMFDPPAHANDIETPQIP